MAGEVFSLNGLKVHRVKDTLFVALPPELWRQANPGDQEGCRCAFCTKDGTKGYWDTLAMPVNPNQRHDTTFTVHYPELHNEVVRKRMAY